MSDGDPIDASNRIDRETAVVRGPNETPNDKNDRGNEIIANPPNLG